MTTNAKPHGWRYVPHTHWCAAGEHNVEHGSEPCNEPLRNGYECPVCRDAVRTFRDRSGWQASDDRSGPAMFD